MVGIDQVDAGFGQYACGQAEVEVCGADDLVLAHRQSADDLGQRLGKGEPGNGVVECGIAACGPCRCGLQRGDAGSDPGKSVGASLVLVDARAFQTGSQRGPGRCLIVSRRGQFVIEHPVLFPD